jgi:phosphoserine phosphatase/GTP:adenosylcobinamide-phosphate guanylyltransferase
LELTGVARGEQYITINTAIMSVCVVIPALNEAATIRSVVMHCLHCALVDEVIVVDDQSADDTAAIARDAGARVLLSRQRGKGISMKEGLDAAQSDIVVYLDADISPYPPQTIENLCAPILKEEADFVKGAFSRNAGRVTTLVAKPLLSLFYPGLSGFNQPLSGMIAGKKTILRKAEFANDYGVDVGILIDMHLMRARMKEVHIGHIDNKSKPWEALGKMSREVSRTIIRKSQRLIPGTVDEDELSTLEHIQQQFGEVLEEELSAYGKMAVFDMDNTILQGRFIDEMAARFGFSAKLQALRDKESDPVILTKRIGLLLKGRSIEEMLEAIGSIPMVDDIKSVVASLKATGYKIGLISNSYQVVCSYVRQEIGADFVLANRLEFFEGKATGEVSMPSYFFPSPDAICSHALCKTHALQYACNTYCVRMDNCLAVGDSADDACMIAHAGKGFAFCSSDEALLRAADIQIKERSFAAMLPQD